MTVVTVVPGGEQIYCEPGTTLLAALFSAGYSYTIGCRRGGCGICKVAVHEGAITHNRPIADTVLTPAERDANLCLSCCAVPVSDVTIELQEGALRLVNSLLLKLNQSAHRHGGNTNTATQIRCANQLESGE